MNMKIITILNMKMKTILILNMFIMLWFQPLMAVDVNMTALSPVSDLLVSSFSQDYMDGLSKMVEDLRSKHGPKELDTCFGWNHGEEYMNFFNETRFYIGEIVQTYYHLSGKEPERNNEFWRKKIINFVYNFQILLKEIEQCLSKPPVDRTRLGFTSLFDMSTDEFQSMFSQELRVLDNNIDEQPILWNDTGIPPCYWPDFDWREKGYVSPVKNQKGCAASFLFAAMATVETSYMIQKKLKYDQCHVDLSEQDLLNCIKTNNNTCNTGGDIVAAYQKMKTNILVEERSCPYVGVVGQNLTDCAKYVVPNGWNITVESYHYSQDSISEIELKVLVKRFGAIAVAINPPSKIQFLVGALNDCRVQSSEKPKYYHYLAVVGWTPDYWILKNSWGPNWGFDGYMYLRRCGDRYGILNVRGFPILGLTG